MQGNNYITIPRGLWRIRSLNNVGMFLLFTLFYCHQRGVKTSRKSLSRHSHLSLSSISRAINRLVELGLITKEAHTDEDGANLTTTYTINEEALLSACGEQP
jgi:DNA-binding MarR family transcriptional regulator